MLERVFAYFNQLNPRQKDAYQQLYNIYKEWNDKINVVSRKDFDNFYVHHVLHSLAIAKFVQFKKGTLIMDLGAGGGFPSIPLAIMFPEAKFLAVDSIQKKLKVIDGVAETLDLKNVKTHWGRAEDIKLQFDFIVTRAVAPMSDLLRWSRGKIHPISFNELDNGLIALKGGDLTEEIKETKRKIKIKPISDYFKEDFFETKVITFVKPSS
ncbi:MAG: 16S rRNA (guanine(527)-N(7))-methyltransferase RsmG [Chitinophagales bacterium]|nr:16S rRNA (guanine(527)-N(7))-methyltransferase RsmG [Chitinophagales bacterium]